MKIDEVSQNINMLNNSGEPVSNGKAEEKSELSSGMERSRQSETAIDFSETSVEFSRALKMMENESVERVEKVNEIKEKIISGNYDIDSIKIADKILLDAITNMI